MSSEPVIHLENLGKSYHLYKKPHERLLQMLLRGRKQYYAEVNVLKSVDLQMHRGESLGIVGDNGAGKSTLLQLVCGTLNPSVGQVKVNGRVAALLELGSGFNPEFTGRENVFLNARILGLSHAETEERYAAIVDFSGIREYMDQPVKTYSSGMYIRLAFSVATCVDPDVLIIDEALSVGDGAFAHKSFKRIMQLKQQGTTILFCSHSLYQVETLCTRALWLERGRVKMLGNASSVVAAYQTELNRHIVDESKQRQQSLKKNQGGYLKAVTAQVGDVSGTDVHLVSQHDSISVTIRFQMDQGYSTPSLALGIANESGLTISSITSVADEVSIELDANGEGVATVVFPQLALLKGTYYITAILACDRALHPYDIFNNCITLHVKQNTPLQGIVALAHEWCV